MLSTHKNTVLVLVLCLACNKYWSSFSSVGLRHDVRVGRLPVSYVLVHICPAGVRTGQRSMKLLRTVCLCTVRAHVTSNLHGHHTSTSKHSVFVRFEFSEGKTKTDVWAVNRDLRGKKLGHWSKFIFLFLKLRNALAVSRLRRKVLAYSHSGSKSSSNCLYTKYKHGLHGGTGSKMFPL